MPETQAQYKARILCHLAGREPLSLLAAAPATLAALLVAVPPPLCARRPAPGKWSIQEIVAHLADDELVGAYRIRLILAAPGTTIQAFDQDRWAETGRYAATDPGRSLALFRALREANLVLWHGSRRPSGSVPGCMPSGGWSRFATSPPTMPATTSITSHRSRRFLPRLVPHPDTCPRPTPLEPRATPGVSIGCGAVSIGRGPIRRLGRARTCRAWKPERKEARRPCGF